MDNLTIARYALLKQAAYDPKPIYTRARAKADLIPQHPLQDIPKLGATGRLGLTTPEATNWDAYKNTAGYAPNSGGLLNLGHNFLRSMYTRPSARYMSAVSGSNAGVAPWSTLSRLYGSGQDMAQQYGFAPKAYEQMGAQRGAGNSLASMLPMIQQLAQAANA